MSRILMTAELEAIQQENTTVIQRLNQKNAAALELLACQIKANERIIQILFAEQISDNEQAIQTLLGEQADRLGAALAGQVETTLSASRTMSNALAAALK